MDSLFDQLTTFGAAGLISAMWLWERRASAQREQQLTDAHNRILSDRLQLDMLIALVRENTSAISQLNASMTQLGRQLENES